MGKGVQTSVGEGIEYLLSLVAHSWVSEKAPKHSYLMICLED